MTATINGPVVMRCEGIAGLPAAEVPEVGQYLAAVDLRAQEDDVYAVAEWTPDKDKAIVFPTFLDGFEAWRQVSPYWPVRADGEPNRPLTLFTVQWEGAA